MEEKDVERDRASQRANIIEQRMFEISLASIDTLKHSTAIEIRKSQNEMKKRLRKYRDRQREIVKSRPGSDKDPIEELITRQMKNKANARQKTRPKTCPGKIRTQNMETNGVFESDSESDIEIDGTFMIDQQRSKIDLRPKTAMEIGRRGATLSMYVNTGRLGSALKQIRYFDEDELKDRGHFYNHLVNKRITEEKNNLNKLDDRVADFCGKDTVQTMLKKMHSKRHVFKKVPDNSNLSNTAEPPQTPSKDKRTRTQSTESHVIVRPHTSHGKERVTVTSFKKPSYIAT